MRGADFSFGRDFASCRDNFDNVLKRIDFGIATDLVGSTKSESVYPSKSIDDIIVFEKPIDGTKSVKIALPKGNIEAEGDPIVIDLPLQ